MSRMHVGLRRNGGYIYHWYWDLHLAEFLPHINITINNCSVVTTTLIVTQDRVALTGVEINGPTLELEKTHHNKILSFKSHNGQVQETTQRFRVTEYGNGGIIICLFVHWFINSQTISERQHIKNWHDPIPWKLARSSRYLKTSSSIQACLICLRVVQRS